MSKIWDAKKKQFERTVRDIARRSPVLTCLGCLDTGPEWRTVVEFDTKTLVRRPGRDVERDGPVVIGVRYHERFLSEAPHPFEIVTVLNPPFIFHPNAKPHGATCLGHPQAGISMDTILHQVWAGLMFDMKFVNTEFGEIANREAAEYVRANQPDFPITKKGLFEEADADLKSTLWYAPLDQSLQEKFRSEMEEGSM